MSAEDVSKFPETSRFFGRADCKLENSQQSSDEIPARSIHMNHFNTNSNFLPFSSPQVKTKVNYPVDLFHLLQKITVDDAREPASERDIPVFEYGLHFANDPVLFTETVASIGKKYGAVKFRFSDSNENLFKTYFQINHDVFNFRTNRMLYNPKTNEVESRLRFYTELVRVHTSLLETNTATKSPGYNGDERSESHSKETDIDMAVSEQEATSLPLNETESSTGTFTDTSTSLIKVEPTNGPKEAKPGKSKLPAFLMKLPMMDKRLLDLYDLFRFVMMKGGFNEVIQKKLWAQIGRELGYKGKITSSLSSSLKSSYAKILYPLELELGQKKAAFLFSTNANSLILKETKFPPDPQFPHCVTMKSHTVYPRSVRDSINHTRPVELPSSKGNLRPADLDDHVHKRRKIADTPLALGSAKEFNRSIRLKASKGFLLNEPHLVDIRSPLVLSVKDKADAAKSEEITPTTAAAQINVFLKWIANSMSTLDDSTRLEANGKLASVYTLRQFVEKDAKFQDFLVSNFPENFGPETSVAFTGESMKCLTVAQAEDLYWKILTRDESNGLMDGMKLENGRSLSHIISGSGFPRVGDDFQNFKSHLNNMGFQTNLSTSTTSSAQGETKVKPLELASKSESLFLNCKPYISRTTGTSLSPFNLHNLPVLPDSLLGAYNAADLNNREMANTSLNIGMTYSTENWRCEDHFTHLCNYLFLGGSKRWFFIPELEFEKFEQLVDEIVAEQDKNPEDMRVNKNYAKDSWQLDKLMEVLGTTDESTNLEYDFLLNSLENMVNPYPELRTKHKDPGFQKLIDLQKKRRVLYNQEYVITPEMLTERGIEYTTTIQRPGEFIIKYPKTFSSAISFGFNLSEEVNFATRTWLDYAQEGEDWLKKQGLLPNMLVFRLLINLAQLYESINTDSIPFSGAVYEKALEIYDTLLAKELALRTQIRELCKLKETVIEDRNTSEAESVSDDDLLNAFPSKVVITEIATHYQFVMTIGGFIAYLNLFGSDKEGVPDFLNDSSYSVDLQLFYSDERLKSYQRLLGGYSVNFKEWMKTYDSLISSGEIIPLKTYKSLLADGQKISVALTTGRETFRKFIYGSHENSESTEQENLKAFQQVLNTLQNFVDESTNIIEECQSILALKHQQRIRNGEQSVQLHDYHSNGLEKLIELVDTIPKLIFHVPEFDQIFEFKTEIENFDRACRALIKREQSTMSDLSDMINLGTSFGLKIPSLAFLVRLRDRQKWLQTYDIIVDGGDPFVGKREVFSLKEVTHLRDEGLQILAKSDLDKLKVIDQYVYIGEKYENAVQKYLADNKVLDKVNLSQLEKLIEDMEEKSKMKEDSRLFVTMDTYHQLLDLKAQSKLIDFLQSYASKTHKLFIVRQIVNDLDECGYQYENSALKADVEEAEMWLADVQSSLDRVDTNFGTKSKKKISSQHTRQACNPNVIKKAFDILNKCETSFAGEDADSFAKSSPYLFLKNIEDDENKTPMRYCLCREYEGGTMIECDRCHEWYHVACVSEKSAISEDDEKYSCPECLLLDYYSTRPVYPVFEDKLLDIVLANLILKGEKLHVQPTAEINMLRAIQGLVVRSKEYFTAKLDSSPYAEHKEVYDMFLFRKFFGNPIMVSDIFCRMLDLLKTVDFRLLMTPERESFNVTITTKSSGETKLIDVNGHSLSQTETSGDSLNSNLSNSVTPSTSSENLGCNGNLSASQFESTRDIQAPFSRSHMTGLGITSHLPIAFQKLAAFQNLALFQQSAFRLTKEPEFGEAPVNGGKLEKQLENEKPELKNPELEDPELEGPESENPELENPKLENEVNNERPVNGEHLESENVVNNATLGKGELSQNNEVLGVGEPAPQKEEDGAN